MQIVSRSYHGKIVLKVHKLSPGAGVLTMFFCPEAVILQKFSVRGQGIDYLKNSPGVSPGGGACWCLELTDALSFRAENSA